MQVIIISPYICRIRRDPAKRANFGRLRQKHRASQSSDFPRSDSKDLKSGLISLSAIYLPVCASV